MTRRPRNITVAAMTLALAPAALWAQGAAPQATAPAVQPADPAAVLQGAQRIGAGRVSAYRKGASTLVVLPAGSIGKPLLWYTEVVGAPAGVVADGGLEVNNALARFERVGDIVHVRDLSTVQKRRAGAAPGETTPAPGAVPGAAPTDPKFRPIDVALSASETGAIIASFPIVGSQPDGALVIDVTATFSNDIPAATGRTDRVQDRRRACRGRPKQVLHRPRARARRCLERAQHITYLAVLPTLQAVGPQPVSVVLGHSLVFLPEQAHGSAPGRPAGGLLPDRVHRVRIRRAARRRKSGTDRTLPAGKGQPGRPRSATPSSPSPTTWAAASPSAGSPTSLPACCSGCRPSRRRASPTPSACWTRPRPSRTRTGRPRT
jgi:hypothetical protein